MKKVIASLAIAGLGAAMVSGAQAQTVGSNPAGTYSVSILETNTPSTTITGATVYNYTATLTQASSASVAVNQFTFGFNQPGEFISGSETATGDFAGGELEPSPSEIIYTAPTGLTLAHPTTTLGFTSPAGFATVSNAINITPSSGATNGAGVGNEFSGPGTPTIPETSSFALLGLGLLPLGLIARRRLAQKN